MSAPPAARRATLSVVMIVLDSEATLERALDSVRWADEIVVLDGGSRDRTVAVAERCGARVYRRSFTDFATQRNAALEHARGDWILSLDADETVSPELAREIEEVLRAGARWSAAEVPFKNFLADRWLRHGGLYPDYHLRLFRRGSGRFERPVHEVLRAEGSPARLRGCIEHRTYRDMADLHRKAERYAALEARLAARSATIDFVFLAKVPYRLVQVYVLRLGFLDGWLGLLHAVALSRYAWLVYRNVRSLRSGQPSS